MQLIQRPQPAEPEPTPPNSTVFRTASGWVVPTWRDPRIPFGALLATYALLGVTVLGFNRNVWQIVLTVLAGCAIEMALAYGLRRQKIVPLSAAISCLSLALILNYSHTYVLLLIPVLLTIGSKYVFTFQGRHVFNPSLFGVATCLLFANEWITAAPAYQYGGTVAMSVFIGMAAVSIFVFKIDRGWLVGSFLVFYALQTLLRAYIMRHHMPPDMLFLGTMTTAPFFLFVFYMLTDPATSPRTPRQQVLVAFLIAAIDLYLHKFESVFTFFYAAFIVASGKLVFLHLRQAWREGVGPYLAGTLFAPAWLRAAGTLAAVGGLTGAIYGAWAAPRALAAAPPFKLEPVPLTQSGLATEMAPVLEQVSPGVRHIAKWVISVGDAVAVADWDGDGRQDLFLTNPLKRPEDRNALYRNLGGFRFARVRLPALTADPDPGAHGLAAAPVFADYDNDGDQDLFLGYGFGPSRLLRNTLRETGRPGFVDVSKAMGVDAHTVCLTANWFDYDRDGKLDLLVGNTLAPFLPDYERPTPLNLFRLPKPAYEGDRRMYRFMHNGWHNADNGGLNTLYRNAGARLEAQDMAAFGMPDTRWTLAVGTGDLNRDGWTDLYLASDFGPDDCYLNKQGRGFERQQGTMFGEIGRDTYKGMNSTVADFDRDGWLDVYVSDVHHALQAEGSLLWMIRPGPDPFRPTFTDEATRRGVLNENRFGWGATAGDLDNDGWVDLVQANGMVDDRLDPNPNETNKDFWYHNHKLMQSGPELHTYADKWGDIRGRMIYPNEPRRVYLNQGDHAYDQFVDVASLVGARDPENSRGVAMADFDDDGDLDVVITNQHGPVSLYRNTLAEGKAGRAWLGLDLRGDGQVTSRDAVGTRVEVSWDEGGKRQTQVREVTLANGFSSQNDRRVHVGLGPQPGRVDVTIRWYGGRETVLRGVAPGRYLRVDQAPT